MYQISYTDWEHLKKKDRFNKQECANKLYQRYSDEEMKSARRR